MKIKAYLKVSLDSLILTLVSLVVCSLMTGKHVDVKTASKC